MKNVTKVELYQSHVVGCSPSPNFDSFDTEIGHTVNFDADLISNSQLIKLILSGIIVQHGAPTLVRGKQ